MKINTNIIEDAAIISLGATPQGTVDRRTLEQVVALLHEKRAVAVMLGHQPREVHEDPSHPLSKPAGVVMGETARIEGASVVASVGMFNRSKNHFLSKANGTDHGFSLSYHGEPDGGKMRVSKIVTCDYCRAPLANSNGLRGKTVADQLAEFEQQQTLFTNLAKRCKFDAETVESFATKHLAAGSDFETAKADAMAIMESKWQNPSFKSHSTITMGDGPAAPGEVLSDALALRMGCEQVANTDRGGQVLLDSKGQAEYRSITPQAQQLRYTRMPDIAAIFLSHCGIETRGWAPGRIVDEALRPQHRIHLAQSTSDFDGILVDAFNKRLRMGYLEKPATWTRWARRVSAPDFKTVNRPALSTLPTPTSINEGGELKYVTLGDKNQTYALVEYRQGVRLTRRAIINDDLGAFNAIPMKQAQACRRLEDDVAYAPLTSNQTLAEDNTAIFTTLHANVGSGSDPAIATLETCFTEMGEQTENGNALDLEPVYLLIAPAERIVTEQLMSLIQASQVSNAVPESIRRLQVIQSSRITAGTWFAAADYNEIDTVEVCFLESEPMPVLTSEVDFDTDDVKFKVRHTVAAAALDWRGLYRNTAP